MGFLYPDNRNRANRVSQLATQIATLQFDVRAEAENIKKKDDRTLEELDKILKAAGYKTREEYIEAALNRLTPEQRAQYQEMRDKLDKTDDALEIGWSVSGALLGIAAFSGLASASIGIVLKLSMVRMSLYTMVIGLVNILKGNIQAGMNMIRSASRAISSVLDGAGLSKKFLTAIRYLKNAAKVLTIIAVILDGILLIYEAIEGAQQRTALQEAIVELCARRFDIQKMKLSIMACDGFTDVASSLVTLQNSMNGLVEQGILTKEQADAAVAKETQNAISIVQRDMDEITDDDAWNILQELDKQSGDAWTNEDPSLDRVLKWIEEHPDDTRHDDEVRWRIEIPDPWRRREICPPEEEICSRELKKVDVKVCVSVFPAKL